MKLSDLVKALKPLCVDHKGALKNTDPEIESVHYRAQEVAPGGLFVAIAGHAADGHDFIETAIKKGAVAVVSQKEFNSEIPNIQVANTRQALADTAAWFYGRPSERLTVIGITGTNGKTTTAYLVESILEQAGYNVGVIGTINYRYAGKLFDNPITTPESLDLQRILADMLRAGVSHVVMEASSHAIDLYRIRSCWFDVAVFINLSQDHLDFHGNMESYWASKKRLFSDYLLAGPKKDRAVAVINCNSSEGKELAGSLQVPTIKIGAGPGDTVRADSINCDLNGIAGEIATPGGKFNLESRLVGAHNLENILCAAGVGLALNLSADDLKSGLNAVTTIPGRLERIENDNGRFVYVDYAHTPDALENVIGALRAVTADRIICVFGCGGDRDSEKRPLMGEIAARLCDLAVITSDNPRTEEPMAIINQILEGTRKINSVRYSQADLQGGFNEKGYTVEADRQRAIRLGISVSRSGDTVLIAGKGHETYQILGRTTIDFDDREEARKALRAVRG
ncbi:MAG: UDP-N-acetylmuramoyl-L-alanyl-D-glutamate--2,6-diaminopimelate ligase [Desulfobacterales bacterium]